MKAMIKAYPVFLKEYNGDTLVYVPDLDIYTEGHGIPDAIAMARDAIGLKWTSYNDAEREFPEASSVEEAKKKAQNDADEDFDYSDGILTFVDVDFETYRNSRRP